MKGKNWLNIVVISIFVILYGLTSAISMIHIVDFFELSNSYEMSWIISIAFEVGAAASLAALTILDKLKRELVIGIFVLLTALQIMGNVYYSFTNLDLVEIKDWIDLFGLNLMQEVQQKRIIAIVSGLPLPVIALGFIKSLVDYLKPAGHHTVFDDEEVEIEKDEPENYDEGVEEAEKETEKETEKEAELITEPKEFDEEDEVELITEPNESNEQEKTIIVSGEKKPEKKADPELDLEKELEVPDPDELEENIYDDIPKNELASRTVSLNQSEKDKKYREFDKTAREMHFDIDEDGNKITKKIEKVPRVNT